MRAGGLGLMGKELIGKETSWKKIMRRGTKYVKKSRGFWRS